MHYFKHEPCKRFRRFGSSIIDVHASIVNCTIIFWSCTPSSCLRTILSITSLQENEGCFVTIKLVRSIRLSRIFEDQIAMWCGVGTCILQLYGIAKCELCSSQFVLVWASMIIDNDVTPWFWGGWDGIQFGSIVSEGKFINCVVAARYVAKLRQRSYLFCFRLLTLFTQQLNSIN